MPHVGAVTQRTLQTPAAHQVGDARLPHDLNVARRRLRARGCLRSGEGVAIFSKCVGLGWPLRRATGEPQVSPW